MCLGKSLTLLMLGFSQDLLTPAPTVLEVAWELLSWMPLGIATSSSSDDSPPTPSLSHLSPSTDSLSGDWTIQISVFIEVTPPLVSLCPSVYVTRSNLCHLM